MAQLVACVIKDDYREAFRQVMESEHKLLIDCYLIHTLKDEGEAAAIAWGTMLGLERCVDSCGMTCLSLQLADDRQRECSMKAVQLRRLNQTEWEKRRA